MKRRSTRMGFALLGLWLLAGVTTPLSAQEASTTAQNQGSESERRVYIKKVKKPLAEVYSKVFTALENGGYFVLFEPNIGKNLEHFSQRWGDDYNRNNLEAIRSLVFCNAWYANRISNVAPELLALCPLHMTLIHKKGMTTILFVRPSQVAVGSPGEKVAGELEKDIVNTLERIVFY